MLKNLLLPTGTILLLFQLAVGQTIGPCHPYPGAAASDCLELISNNFGSDAALSCGSTLTIGSCSIVTRCTQGPATFTGDDVVRRALTTIGSCALSDYGSISGYYIAGDGAKTCYLYPGK